MKNLSARFPLKNLSISKAYLFGGQMLSDKSKDIDLLIVSEDFEGVSRIKRREKVILNFKNEKIDPICLSLNEYTRLVKSKSLFLKAILRKSELVYEKGHS